MGPIVIIFSLLTHEPRMVVLMDYYAEIYDPGYLPRQGEGELILPADARRIILRGGVPDLNTIKRLIKQ